MQRWRFDRALVRGAWLDGAVIAIEDGHIAGIGTGSADREFAGSAVPGYVDTHCHGGGGVDFRTDPFVAARAHRRAGTTSVFASLVSADVDELVAAIAELTPYVDDKTLAGIHLEGPFLAPSRRGAHDAASLRTPSDAAIRALLAAGPIAMVTLAPELAGATDAIAQFARAGVRVAFGHSAADATTTKRAIDAGITAATHLCNAMESIHHREPGPIPVLLGDDRVAVELIADGIHVDPLVATMLARCAGERLILVSDAMAAASAADGTYVLGEREVVVRGGVARCLDQTLAGSTITLADAVAHVIAWGLEPTTALAAATSTPARWHDLRRVGVLEVGARADICVLDDQFRVQTVVATGRVLDS